MQVPFMFTCVRAVHAPCFLSPFSFRFSSKVTLPLPPPSQPPFAATVPAAVRRMQEYLSPASQARKPPRSTLSASRVCSSAPPRPRNPKHRDRCKISTSLFSISSPITPRSVSAALSISSASSATQHVSTPSAHFLAYHAVFTVFSTQNLPAIRLHERMSGEVFLCRFSFCFT